MSFSKALKSLLLCGVLLALVLAAPLANAMRIKDLARIQGVRSNQLFGMGLVVGLNDTGDDDLQVTRQMMENMVRRMGVNIDGADLAAGNVAAVMVTAELPAFVKSGDRIDINVSSIGDAESLDGGMLIQTALQAADGRTYAVAQGPISIGGVDRAGRSTRGGGNIRTTASIPGGAIVERAVPMAFSKQQTVTIALNKPDFTTAGRIEAAINAKYGEGMALARDPATVITLVPERLTETPVRFVADLEGITVSADAAAQIVINERTGTIVIGGDMDIQPVTIAHGSLSITITEVVATVQDNTIPVPEAEGTGAEPKKEVIKRQESLVNLRPDGQQGVSIRNLVELLNQIGVTPKDVVAILQALRAAGAISAEIKMM